MITPQDSHDGIAIIGMSGRFPGARDIDEYWANLRDGVESISFFSTDELKAAGVHQQLIDDPNYVRAHGLLGEIDLFDAAFFGFRGQEAEIIDPQHRLFLESAWEALEYAGYDSERYDGAIGVYAGVGVDTYALSNLLSNPELLKSVGLLQASIRNRTDHLTTQVSYCLNLRGPGVTVQTACSTSLVAIHMACQSLLNGECDMAMSGGVSLTVPQRTGYVYREGSILSPDGHCRAFDADARGTVAGSGVGVVVMKRLEDALADRDTIHAVIRGSAINNDGSNKVGYTAPSVDGQAEVIAEALAVADVDPATIGYIEAHGTGTTLGDPIEIEALTTAFGGGNGNPHRCALGAVKANIGHLDTAAGVAGLIKTVLTLKNRQIPPTLHFHSPNPRIDLEHSPFYVTSKLLDWAANGSRRRAGVSSFGLGGTNAHVVLEEAPAQTSDKKSRPWHLLPLSAKTSTALEQVTSRLASFLRDHPDANLADIAYTLQVGRRRMKHQRVVVCKDGSAADALEDLNPKRVHTSVKEPKRRPVIFMFTGQGAQYANMGRELYDAEPVFRRHVDTCAEALIPYLGRDLREVLFPDAADVDKATHDLAQTCLTQPALFVIEYALAQLWIDWGVKPEAMIGHSIGEYVAACLAGVFSLEDALKLVALRGKLMQSLPGGSMLAVTLPENEISGLLDTDLSLAAVNGPQQCVVSGPTESVAQLADTLNERGVGCRLLHTSHAFHSQMMEPILESFAAEVAQIDLQPPQIPYVSNVTGDWITESDTADPNYWARHLRQTVRFHDGLTQLVKDPDWVLLEVGPGWTLMSVARWHPLRAPGQLVLTSLRSAKNQESESNYAHLMVSLGQLWLAGVDIAWDAMYSDQQRRRVPLPTYPFERKRYWIDAKDLDSRAFHLASTRNEQLSDWFFVPSWQRSASQPLPPANDDPESWLLLTDDEGVGEELAAQLRRRGHHVTQVRCGGAFASLGEDCYTLNPANREEFSQLLTVLDEQQRLPTRITHLWCVSSPKNSASNEHWLERGFYSLLYLAQAWGEVGQLRETRLSVVSSGVREVTGTETLCPEKAAVIGPCRAIPREMPNVVCRSIDIELPADKAASRSNLGRLLLGELSGAADDRIVALRGRHRWTPQFESVPLAAAEHSDRLRDGGVYLITGGLGGIGLELADYLASATRAKLVLTGRSAFPPREDWDRWLASHAPDDEVSLKIKKLRALEDRGAEVIVATADAADEEAMRQLVDGIRRHFGGVHGVIHAAGVSGGGMIPLQTREEIDAVLAPKVHGTRVLERIFHEERLDFLILCSSRSSILGGFGQVDYCAANAFLDAFAHYHLATSGTPTIAINWPGWQEVGMRVKTLAALGVGSTTSQPAPADAGHPLLGRVIENTPSRQVYATDFRVADHWVLDDHRIVRKAVIPGVAYLEIARAAIERQAPGSPIELNDIFFLAACAVRDDEAREVRTVVERSGDEFEFRVSARATADQPSGSEWQDIAFGKARLLPRESQHVHDVQEMIRRCNGREIVATDEPLTHDDLGPRWQNLKKAHIGDNELVAELELLDEFADDLPTYKLHPGLLDRTNGAAKIYLSGEGFYMPMSYESVRILRPLPQRVFAYHRFFPDDDPQRETISFDVILMDEQGAELVVIKKFAQKRVKVLAEPIKKGFASTTSLASSSTQESGVNAVTGDSGPSEEGSKSTPKPTSSEVSPSEGVEAFRRILASSGFPQIVVSPNDLPAAIEQADAAQQPSITAELATTDSTRTTHERPELAAEYVAPRNELEERLAKIWQDTLGIDQVGIRDNFFDLGGDSVVGIQMLAQLNKAGFQLTPQQLFQYQTIAALAATLGGDDAPADTTSDQTSTGGTAATQRQEDHDYWLDERRRNAARLPVDLAGNELELGAQSWRRLSVTWDAKRTASLLDSLTETDRIDVTDVLVAALVQSLAKLTESDLIVMDIARSETAADDSGNQEGDTYQWTYPALLEQAEAASAGDALKSIKDQLRRIPREGRGFAEFQHQVDDEHQERFHSLPPVEAGFEHSESGGDGDADAFISHGNHLLRLRTFFEDGTLNMAWNYREGAYHVATIERMSQWFLEALDAYADYCHSEAAAAYTPADFSLADVDQQQLDRIVANLKNT